MDRNLRSGLMASTNHKYLILFSCVCRKTVFTYWEPIWWNIYYIVFTVCYLHFTCATFRGSDCPKLLFFFISWQTLLLLLVSSLCFLSCSSFQPPSSFFYCFSILYLLCPAVWPDPALTPRGGGTGRPPCQSGDGRRGSGTAIIPAAADPVRPGGVPGPGEAAGWCRGSPHAAVLVLPLWGQRGAQHGAHSYCSSLHHCSGVF